MSDQATFLRGDIASVKATLSEVDPDSINAMGLKQRLAASVEELAQIEAMHAKYISYRLWWRVTRTNATPEEDWQDTFAAEAAIKIIAYDTTEEDEPLSLEDFAVSFTSVASTIKEIL